MSEFDTFNSASEFVAPELYGQGFERTRSMPGLPQPPAQRPDPTFWQSLSASFRHDNILGSIIANQVDGDVGPVDPNFNLWEYVNQRPERLQNWDRYVRRQAFNQRRAEQVDRQIQSEAEDKRILDNTPWWLAMGLGVAVGGLADPTVFMPGGALVRVGRGAYSVGASARSIGLAAGAATAVQETALQTIQLNRGIDESMMNIGGGVVLGALIGAGAARLLSPAQRRAALNVIDNSVPDLGEISRNPLAGQGAVGHTVGPGGTGQATSNVPTVQTPDPGASVPAYQLPRELEAAQPRAVDAQALEIITEALTQRPRSLEDLTGLVRGATVTDENTPGMIRWLIEEGHIRQNEDGTYALAGATSTPQSVTPAGVTPPAQVEPRPPLPSTPAVEVRGELSGFRGYDFEMRAANDPVAPRDPNAPVATEVDRIPLERLFARERGEDIFDRTHLSPHDQARFAGLTDADGNRPVKVAASVDEGAGNPTDDFRAVAAAVQQLADQFGLRVRIFMDETNNMLKDRLGAHWYTTSAEGGFPGIIVVNRGLSREAMHAAAFHELGHLIDKARLRHASPELRAQIMAEYDAWRERMASATDAREVRPLQEGFFNEEVRMSGRTDIDPNRPLPLNDRTREYYTSFGEWFADQIAHWLSSNAKPRTLLEEFFSSLAGMWRRLFEKVGDEVAPSVDAFMRGQWDANVPFREGGAEVRGRTPDTPGATVMMRGANENAGAAKALDEAKVEGDTVSVGTGDLGAATVSPPPREQLAMKGKWARRVAAPFAFMIPNIRLNFSPSPEVRFAAQRMVESVFTLEGHRSGVTATGGGPSAEGIAKLYMAKYEIAVRDSTAVYNDMVKAGNKMSFEEFGEAIGLANSNKDVAVRQDNEFVTRAAQIWRSQFWDPILQEGIRVGLFPKNVTIQTAGSYFPRHINKSVLGGNEQVWHQRNVPYWEEQLQTGYTRELEKLNNALARYDEQITDLSRTGEDRSKLVERLATEMDLTRVRYAPFAKIENRIREISSELRQKPPPSNAADLRAEKTALRQTDGYMDYERYIRNTGGRIRRLSRIDPANRLEQLHDRILLEEDRAYTTLRSTIDRVRSLESKYDRADPEIHAEQVIQARDQIETFISGVRERQAKLEQQLTKETQRFLDLQGKHTERRQAIADQWKALEQQLGDPLTRNSAANERAKQKLKLDEENLRLEENELRLAQQTLKRLEKDSAWAQRDKGRYDRMREKLDRLEDFDPEAGQAIVRETIDKLAERANDMALRRGGKIQRMLDRMNEIDPKWTENEIKRLETNRQEIEDRFYRKWETRNVEGVGTATPNFSQMARDISQEAYDKYLGRATVNDSSARPDYIWTIQKGPMRDRTYNVPDFVLDPPGDPIRFFNRNVFEVGNIYGRQVAGDIGLARLFDGDPTLRNVLGDVARDGQPAVRGTVTEGYDRLINQVRAATSAEEVYRVLDTGPGMLDRARELLGRPKSLEDLKKQAEVDLRAQEKNNKSDLQTLRDQLRGTFQVAENNGHFGRIARGVQQINYFRVMGGQSLSMMTDLYRPAMVRGMAPFMANGVEQLMGNLAAIKASFTQLQQYSLVTNAFMNRTLLTFADIGDPHLSGTPLERFLQKATQIASTWNGSRMMQDFSEGMGGTITQTHILRIALDGKAKEHTEYLAGLGLTENLMERIAREFQRPGNGEIYKSGRGEVIVPNTSLWTDQMAREALAGAVRKEVDMMFSTRRIGDIPFFMRTPLGSMLLQFNTFNVASYSNVLVKGIQGERARFLGALIPMTGIGMMTAYLQAAAGGQERFDRFRENVRMNPGFLIGEGIDRSGFFALPFLGANWIESAAAAGGFGRRNPIKYPLMMAGGEIPPELESRASNRGILQSIGGPTAGLIESVPQAAGAVGAMVRGEEPTKRQQRGLVDVMPANTFPGMRQVIQYIYGDLTQLW